ncbi:hypothetical protein GE09DRAFT_1060754 [Coniochaeta sp. 2T2.1]|nr:hypothetical protein GE09DRAFT_1060754 [Coniochaeta sp. 2T2.1]
MYEVDDWHQLNSGDDRVSAVHLVHGEDPKHLFWNHWSIHLAIGRGQYIRLDSTGLDKLMIKRLPALEDEPDLSKREELAQWVMSAGQPGARELKRKKETTATEFIRELWYRFGVGDICSVCWLQ